MSLPVPVVGVSQLRKARKVTMCLLWSNIRKESRDSRFWVPIWSNELWLRSQSKRRQGSHFRLKTDGNAWQEGKRWGLFSPHHEGYSQHPYNQASLIDPSDSSFMWHGAFRMKTQGHRRGCLFYTLTLGIICKKYEWTKHEIMRENQGRNQWSSQIGTFLVSWCKHCFF